MTTNRLSKEDLVDEIRLLIIDAIDNPCGGLFASEIQIGLHHKGINVSSQRIVDLIRYRGRHIKIRTIKVGSKWMNMYYTSPPLDLESGYITIKPTKMDKDDWIIINEAVKQMGGLWISEGRLSHWSIPYTRARS